MPEEGKELESFYGKTGLLPDFQELSEKAYLSLLSFPHCFFKLPRSSLPPFL